MTKTASIDVRNNDLTGAFGDLAVSILALEDIAAILVPQQLPMKAMVMPVLVTDPDQVKGVDPIAPALPLNAAKVVSRLTRKSAGEQIAVMMRPCEIRAFVELIKLKQASRDDLVIIGFDCPGVFSNRDFSTFERTWKVESTTMFLQAVMKEKNDTVDGVALAGACQVCEHFTPEGSDLAVVLLGVDTDKQLLVRSQSARGEAMLERLSFPAAEVPMARIAAIDALATKRTAARDDMAAATAAATDSLEKLTHYLAGCVNCYNCRVACPVCYCQACVFTTDVFDHDPAQYLGWARRNGAVKMPTDTVFYHMTRLAHMSTACVGCGQCSNACPNDVPVMELFRTVALRTQAAFDYRAGMDETQRPPLSEFKEEEFEEVVGIE